MRRAPAPNLSPVHAQLFLERSPGGRFTRQGSDPTLTTTGAPPHQPQGGADHTLGPLKWVLRAKGLHRAVRNHLLSASFLSATGSVLTGTYPPLQDADLTASFKLSLSRHDCPPTPTGLWILFRECLFQNMDLGWLSPQGPSQPMPTLLVSPAKRQGDHFCLWGLTLPSARVAWGSREPFPHLWVPSALGNTVGQPVLSYPLLPPSSIPTHSCVDPRFPLPVCRPTWGGWGLRPPGPTLGLLLLLAPSVPACPSPSPASPPTPLCRSSEAGLLTQSTPASSTYPFSLLHQVGNAYSPADKRKQGPHSSRVPAARKAGPHQE